MKKIYIEILNETVEVSGPLIPLISEKHGMIRGYHAAGIGYVAWIWDGWYVVGDFVEEFDSGRLHPVPARTFDHLVSEYGREARSIHYIYESTQHESPLLLWGDWTQPDGRIGIIRTENFSGIQKELIQRCIDLDGALKEAIAEADTK